MNRAERRRRARGKFTDLERIGVASRQHAKDIGLVEQLVKRGVWVYVPRDFAETYGAPWREIEV